LRLDTIEHTVRRGEREIALSPMEYRVLEYLAHRPRAVISKTELLEHLYDYNWEKFSNVIEVYISGLRRKIDDDEAVKLIHTMRGHGYVLRAEALPSASAAKQPQGAAGNMKSGEQPKKAVKH
jgi:DNA-binding response OmpR family regulator